MKKENTFSNWRQEIAEKVKGPVEVMPELEDPEGQRNSDKKMPKAPKEKVKEGLQSHRKR